MNDSWERTALSNIIARLDSGVSVNAGDRPANEGEIGVLKVSAVLRGHFFPDENKVVVGDDRSRLLLSAKRGDILISRANTFELIGASGFVDADYPNLFLPDKLWKVGFHTLGRDCPKWLIHLLNSPEMRTALRARASGTSGSMKNISKDAFLGIIVYRPPHAEQVLIGRTLDLWDRSIGQAQRLLKLKRRRKRGLMQQLLTGRRRFPEFAGQPWRKVQIGDVLKEVHRTFKLDPQAQYRLVSIRRRSGGFFDRETRFGHQISYPTLEQIHAGDFVIARRQVLHGAMATVPAEFHGAYVSNAYAILEAHDRDKFHVPFFNFVSQQPRLYYLAYRCSYGVAIEKMFFGLEWFLKETLRIPPTLAEQVKISAVLATADREIALLEQQLAALHEQKKGLMQKLLTGQIRLKSKARQR